MLTLLFSIISNVSRPASLTSPAQFVDDEEVILNINTLTDLSSPHLTPPSTLTHQVVCSKSEASTVNMMMTLVLIGPDYHW